MNISQQIADIIIRRLIKLKITKSEFAAMIPTQPSTITRWLSGTHNFTTETLDRIQNVLHISFIGYAEPDADPCAPCIVEQFLIK